MNFDIRTTDKFSKIFEAIGYLLLDFNNKPKQLDRFIGYIAMVHKDMRLNEQDLNVHQVYCFVKDPKKFTHNIIKKKEEGINYLSLIV